MSDGNQNTIITDINESQVVKSSRMDEEDSNTEKTLQDSYIPNIIILGNVKPAQENGDVNPKRKKKKPMSELEALGVTEVKEEFDTFTDEADNIYRKYKLRNAVKKPDYKDLSTRDLILYKAKKHDCQFCDRVFQTARKLQTHMKRHHNEFKCSQCSIKFETNDELISHKSVHDEENKAYLCHSCKVAFSNYCDYLVHGLTHGNSGPKVCPECGIKTVSRLTFINHVRTHFYKTCSICDEELPGDHILEEHVCKRICNIECVECGKVFNNEMHYNDHMAMHIGVKIHQCLYCGKGFYTQNQKEIHTRTHIDD